MPPSSWMCARTRTPLSTTTSSASRQAPAPPGARGARAARLMSRGAGWQRNPSEAAPLAAYARFLAEHRTDQPGALALYRRAAAQAADDAELHLEVADFLAEQYTVPPPSLLLPLPMSLLYTPG